MSITIKDPRNPRLLDEVPIQPPYGLASRDTLLYVSIGTRGFELYSIRNPRELQRLKFWGTPETKDFIWAESLLYIMSFRNIRIFDVRNPFLPVDMSVID